MRPLNGRNIQELLESGTDLSPLPFLAAAIGVRLQEGATSKALRVLVVLAPRCPRVIQLLIAESALRGLLIELS